MGLTATHVDDAAPVGRTLQFTVRQVLRMADVGILREDEHVELLDGSLFVVSPKGPRHRSRTNRLHHDLLRVYGDGYVVQQEAPLIAGETSLPEPDLCVLRGTDDDFEERDPRADEAVLIIEIAWTSQEYDLKKVPLYAGGRAPCLWLLDIANRKLAIHELPTRTGRYRNVRTLTEDDTVELPLVGVTWRVADLLPKRG